jgi:transposase
VGGGEVIQITPQMRILVAVRPADFRKGIDGLAGVCRTVLRQDPMSGAVFVFRNRRATAIKILVYDSQGFWLAQKRLSRGKFQWWPESGVEAVRELEARELQLVLWNGDPSRARMQPVWRGLSLKGWEGGEKS